MALCACATISAIADRAFLVDGVGAVTDGSFGKLVAFGLGGVLVEVLKDITFRLAPATTVDALSTMAVGDLVKVVAWYDNETGYATRLYELTKYVASKGL